MKYFKTPYTAVNLNKQFRERSKKLHPDVEGGDHRRFTEMQNQYRDLLYIVDNGEIPLNKCQSEYFKKHYADKKPGPRAADKVYTNEKLRSVLKTALKKELKKRKSKVSYSHRNTVYIVNVNDFLTNVLDKLF